MGSFDYITQVLDRAVEDAQPIEVKGRVIQVVGTIIKAAVPGVKVGLANIAVVFALYKLGWKEAVAISLVRVVLVSLLFGSLASLFYSFAGAVLSLLGMGLLKRSGRFTEIVVSVAGGILHNIGQIAMASVILETDALRYYLPFLLLSGTVAGVVIGVISAIMVKRIQIN